jgi:hypothetical protein
MKNYWSGMTGKQIKEVIRVNRYVLFKYNYWQLVGYNCKQVMIPIPDEKVTQITGWRPCSFQEYISCKLKFI